MTLRLKLPVTIFQELDHHRVHDYDEDDHQSHDQSHEKYEDCHHGHDQAEDNHCDQDHDKDGFQGENHKDLLVFTVSHLSPMVKAVGAKNLQEC